MFYKSSACAILMAVLFSIPAFSSDSPACAYEKQSLLKQVQSANNARTYVFKKNSSDLRYFSQKNLRREQWAKYLLTVFIQSIPFDDVLLGKAITKFYQTKESKAPIEYKIDWSPAWIRVCTLNSESDRKRADYVKGQTSISSDMSDLSYDILYNILLSPDYICVARDLKKRELRYYAGPLEMYSDMQYSPKSDLQKIPTTLQDAMLDPQEILKTVNCEF